VTRRSPSEISSASVHGSLFKASTSWNLIGSRAFCGETALIAGNDWEVTDTEVFLDILALDLIDENIKKRKSVNFLYWW
jgi:hypothetical protein